MNIARFVICFVLLGSVGLSVANARSGIECHDEKPLLFISSKVLRAVSQSDHELIKSRFDRCNVVVGGSKDVLRDSFDLGLSVSRRMMYKSVAELEQDLDTNQIQGKIDYVVYNPEPAFTETPEYEKRDVVRYAIKFARLARQHGFKTVAAPSCRLVKEKQADRRYALCAKSIYEQIAPYYDVIDIQAQELQSDSDLYYRVVRNAARSIRSASSGTKVVSQLTTVNARRGDAHVLGEAATATRSILDGFWINVDNNSADGKDDFVEFLKKYHVYD